MELCLGVGEKLSEILRVRISKPAWVMLWWVSDLNHLIRKKK